MRVCACTHTYTHNLLHVRKGDGNDFLQLSDMLDIEELEHLETVL
jgi:hypothetical protein